jgi:CheY-specific phosphatase CheX
MSNLATLPDLERMLEVATSEALETMCFFGVMGPTGQLTDGPEHISARMTFKGDAEGVFHSTLDTPAAWAIAANFLGEDESEISREQVDTVVCELANMICGSVLSSYKRDGHFELSTPEITQMEDSQPDEVVRRVFELETGCIGLAIDFRPKP